MKLMWKIAGAAMLVLFTVLLVWVYSSPRQDVSLKVIRFETNLSTVAPVPFDKPQPYVVAVLCLTNASRRAVAYAGNPSGHPFCRLSAMDGDGWRQENESVVGFGMGGGRYQILEPSRSVNFPVVVESSALRRGHGPMTVSVPYQLPLSTGGIWEYLPKWVEEQRARGSRRVAHISFEGSR